MPSNPILIHAVIDTSYLIKYYGDNKWRSNPRLGLDTIDGQIRYHIPVIVLQEIANLIKSGRTEISERARSVRGNLLKLRGRFDEPATNPPPVEITDPLGADSLVDRKLLAIAEAYLETDPDARVILLTNDCGIKRSVLSRHGRRKRFIRGWHENTCRVAAVSIGEAAHNARDARSRSKTDRQLGGLPHRASYPSNHARSEVVDTHGLRVRDMGLLDIVFHIVLAVVIVFGLFLTWALFLGPNPGVRRMRAGTAETPLASVASHTAGSGLSERIRLGVDAARNRNEQALQLCESEVNTILAREFQEIERRGNLAAENLSTYGSCCNIIYRLAKEQIWSSGASDRPAAPTPKTALEAFEAAESKREARMAAAAERAGLSFWEARQADASAVWNGTKWASSQAGRGATNADGYVAAAVEIPEGYIAAADWSRKTREEARLFREEARLADGRNAEYADGKLDEYAIVLPGQAIQSGVGAVEAGAADGPESPPRGDSSSEAYVQEEVLKEVQPVLDACAGELNTALNRYERALRASTTTLAYELAQAGVGTASAPDEIQVGMPTQRDVDAALRDLGFDGVSIAVAGAFDIPAILNSTLLSGILGKASQLAATTFARPAAAAAGSAVVAAADGPLPVGDGIALLGGAVTAYQIYSARGDFEKAIKESLAKALPEMKRDVHSQVVERIHVLQAAYQQAQDEIRNQSVSTLGR
jgi:rRNA-processing protein FCF1